MNYPVIFICSGEISALVQLYGIWFDGLSFATFRRKMKDEGRILSANSLRPSSFVLRLVLKNLIPIQQNQCHEFLSFNSRNSCNSMPISFAVMRDFCGTANLPLPHCSLFTVHCSLLSVRFIAFDAFFQLSSQVGGRVGSDDV